MKRTDKNQKAILTFDQLKKLVKESAFSNNGTLYKNNDIPYFRVFSATGYSDIKIFGANSKDDLISYLISDFDMKKDMAIDTAKGIWGLKQYESYMNVIRLM